MEVSPFPWRGLPSSQLLWEFVVLALEETALYLKATFLCRRFCRFIEPLLQSWPLGPFISYRTFYLRFMEHAIRPDIPTVAQYWDLTNNLVLFFEQLMSQKENKLNEWNMTSTFVSGKGSTYCPLFWNWAILGQKWDEDKLFKQSFGSRSVVNFSILLPIKDPIP